MRLYGDNSLSVLMSYRSYIDKTAHYLDLAEKEKQNKPKQQNGKQQMCHFPPCEGYMYVVLYQTAVIGSQPLTEVSHTVSHSPA